VASGAIFAVRQPENEVVYYGPAPDLNPGLIDELIEQFSSSVDKTPAIVRAGMAHLNLANDASVQGWERANARVLQTLGLAREGVLSPALCSIEEWLGRNTHAYYEKLMEVGQGAWHPENDTFPWIRICLRAH
jgi:hypothetical protein